jgi:BirA family transcriptional regulator, biotin operon repressor / biotin---[acetyl-CoA-carboxylase] ligase
MTFLNIDAALRGITLGGFRYFESTGSTNDDALAWATHGAPDLALVVADTQVNGRGREGRKWFTPPGAGLAFSLVMRLTSQERAQVTRFSGLGALALVDAFKMHGIHAQIKWPNDVLIRRKKVAGILVELVWLGSEVDSLILGMGVNVSSGSLPPKENLTFPATCIEEEAGVSVERYLLLKEILDQLIRLRASVDQDMFLEAWQETLAFRGEGVQIWQGHGQPFDAELVGLEGDGSLQVRLDSGEVRVIHYGEVHLRPLRYDIL